MAQTLQLAGNTPRSVTPPMLLKDLPHERCEFTIRCRAWALHGDAPLVVGSTTHLENVAQVLHFKTFLLQLLDHHINIRYSCWLKMTNAFF